MVQPEIDQLADFAELLFKHVKVIQKNNLSICGKLLDVIPDETSSRLHRLIIEQNFISIGSVGNLVRESRLTVATVFTKNVLTIEEIE